MHAILPLLHDSDFPPLQRSSVTTLQVNLGYRCNQACLHCHVNAGPSRTEAMNWPTMEAILALAERASIETLDLTGGAPELNPHFRALVERASAIGLHVIDRCNLTILEEPEQQDLADFLAAHRVEIVASLPCYLEDNVDRQRGDGVFQASLRGLRKLNALGYGKTGSQLPLNLVYNPQGPVLPPDQDELEEAYHRELFKRYGIEFNQLFALTNMPIQRFGSTLVSQGRFETYLALLKGAHRDANLDRVMCKSLISIDWQGLVYDCDFNQMLGVGLGGQQRHVRDVDPAELRGAAIATAAHCYGCTAGSGSSCQGSLVGR